MQITTYTEKPTDNQCNILELFHTKNYLKLCAPMVRYSKLQFRQLVKLYDCDLTFTPMILADSMVLSEKARNNEFSTSLNDTPLITQFAANNVNDFVGASILVSPFCDGVDLNCGCPQRWAKKLGIGCALMDNPELVCSIVKECKQTIEKKPFTVSVKARILNDAKRTVDFYRKLEKAGADFITVHARTADQHTGNINQDLLKLIVENVSCPVIGNGGIESLDDCDELYKRTKCKGVMSANGILCNPTLFSGQTFNFQSAKSIVEIWIKLCFNEELISTNSTENSKFNILNLSKKPKNVTFQCFHHHLVFMLSRILRKHQKQIFNNLRSFEEVFNFLSNNNLLPDGPLIRLDDNSLMNMQKIIDLSYDTQHKFVENHKSNFEKQKYSSENSDGAFFSNFTSDDLNLDEIFN